MNKNDEDNDNYEHLYRYHITSSYMIPNLTIKRKNTRYKVITSSLVELNLFELKKNMHVYI